MYRVYRAMGTCHDGREEEKRLVGGGRQKGNEKFMRGANLGLVDALVALTTTVGPNRPNPPGFKCSLHFYVSFFNTCL